MLKKAAIFVALLATGLIVFASKTLAGGQMEITKLPQCTSSSCFQITTVKFGDPPIFGNNLTVEVKGLKFGATYTQNQTSPDGAPYVQVVGRNQSQVTVDLHALPCEQYYILKATDGQTTAESKAFKINNSCIPNPNISRIGRVVSYVGDKVTLYTQNILPNPEDITVYLDNTIFYPYKGPDVDPEGKYVSFYIDTETRWRFGQYNISLISDGKQTNSVKFFLTTPVQVRWVNPYLVAPGQTLSIRGLNFGTQPGTVLIYDTNGAFLSLAQIVSWNNTDIKIQPPDNLQTNKEYQFEINSTYNNTAIYMSRPTRFYLAEKPKIETITPSNGSPNQMVTISGTNFGTQPGLVRFNIGNRTYGVGQVNFWSDTQIRVVLPRNLVTNQDYSLLITSPSTLVTSDPYILKTGSDIYYKADRYKFVYPYWWKL